MRALLSIVTVLLVGSAVHAEPNAETYKNKAFLTLSAFQCAVLAPNDRDAERLFLIALKAGREFIEFVNNNPDLYEKTIRPQIPMLWYGTTGPTPDFILGRIYAHMSREAYDKLGTDSKSWKVKKEIMYQEKNCALISGN